MLSPLLQVGGQALADRLELRFHRGVERVIVTQMGTLVLELREIEPCEISSGLVGSLTICQSCLLSRVESAKPEESSVLGEYSDLSHPLAPLPLPHSPVKLVWLRWSPSMLQRDRFRAKKIGGGRILARGREG